jgi:ribonucleoside-triphosphate reductase
MKVRLEGHGEGDEKKPYVYPKLVFLYDRDLHGKKGRLYELFRTAVEWSAKAGYSEYLSLSGEKGMVSEVYKEYGKALSPMGCMLFLTKWYERGGEAPADDDDEPVFSGRFSIGTVTLNLPMIFALSKTKNTDFFAELDHYLELSRQIHKRTYELLAVQKADIDPLAFMQGGFYGGTLESGECIGPLLKSATALFGFTALNELQQLYNKNSIAEDGKFAFDVLKHINEKAEEFRKEDHIQYSVYGTPCESLCNAQCDTFKEKYGSGEEACAIEHFSNSFHCCESEEIEPVRRQNLEARFWNYSDGGKIQYTQCTTPEDTAALEAMIVHAMELGLYEGINI